MLAQQRTPIEHNNVQRSNIQLIFISLSDPLYLFANSSEEVSWTDCSDKLNEQTKSISVSLLLSFLIRIAFLQVHSVGEIFSPNIFVVIHTFELLHSPFPCWWTLLLGLSNFTDVIWSSRTIIKKLWKGIVTVYVLLSSMRVVASISIRATYGKHLPGFCDRTAWQSRRSSSSSDP